MDMSTCSDCHASLTASEISVHNRRFHKSMAFYTYTDCPFTAVLFSDTLIHALLHGHGPNISSSCRTQTKKQALVKEVQQYEQFADAANQESSSPQSELDIIRSTGPKRSSFNEIYESTVNEEPSAAKQFTFQAVDPLFPPDASVAPHFKSDIELTEPSQMSEKKPSMQGKDHPSCVRCLKIVNISKGSLATMAVRHVVHCMGITPFVCTGCSAAFARRFCVHRHARQGRTKQCETATAALNNREADEHRIRDGLHKCFPGLEISWIGLR